MPCPSCGSQCSCYENEEESDQEKISEDQEEASWEGKEEEDSIMVEESPEETEAEV